MGVHPEDHAGDEHHGDGADDRLHRLLARLRQRLLEQVEPDADGDREGDGEADAGPHRGEAMAVALEEGGDDADDQRGLKAFAQADDESC